MKAYIQNKKRQFYTLVLVFACFFVSATACAAAKKDQTSDFSDLVYEDKAYVAVNDNQPSFTDKEKKSTEAFENYSDLDDLGRCGVAYANICKELMPTDKRGEIGSVKPSGWQTQKYDIVNGKYLYNRCHLIGFQLAGENANDKNLITGTRYLNIEGMLPFENLVDDYVDETGNHVLYRVTPIFEGDNLVASGVQMEGWSVEDDGDGVCFNVYCFNVQPGIVIDYATGDSVAEEDYKAEDSKTTEASKQASYVYNEKTKKFHTPDCSMVERMKEENKQYFTGDKKDLIDQGYEPCKKCNP